MEIDFSLSLSLSISFFFPSLLSRERRKKKTKRRTEKNTEKRTLSSFSKLCTDERHFGSYRRRKKCLPITQGSRRMLLPFRVLLQCLVILSSSLLFLQFVLIRTPGVKSSYLIKRLEAFFPSLACTHLNDLLSSPLQSHYGQPVQRRSPTTLTVESRASVGIFDSQ